MVVGALSLVTLFPTIGVSKIAPTSSNVVLIFPKVLPCWDRYHNIYRHNHIGQAISFTDINKKVLTRNPIFSKTCGLVRLMATFDGSSANCECLLLGWVFIRHMHNYYHHYLLPRLIISFIIHWSFASTIIFSDSMADINNRFMKQYTSWFVHPWVNDTAIVSVCLDCIYNLNSTCMGLGDGYRDIGLHCCMYGVRVWWV